MSKSKLFKFEKSLLTLKDMITIADDFKEIYNYFFDHLGDDLDFLDLGKRSKNPFLKQVLGVIGEQLFKEKVEITQLMLTKIPKHSFYHGPCLMNGKMASVLFFEDIDMGLLSVVMSLGSYRTDFIRFSSIQMENGKDVIYCAPKSKTIH